MYIDIGNAAGKQSMLQPATVTKRLLRESRGECSQPRQGQRSRPAGVEVGWAQAPAGEDFGGEMFLALGPERWAESGELETGTAAGLLLKLPSTLVNFLIIKFRCK